MSNDRVGKFRIKPWTGSAPIWLTFEADGQEVHHLKDEDLPDLLYAVRRAIREANAERRRCNLPLLPESP